MKGTTVRLQPGEQMLSAQLCRALADEFKANSHVSTISRDRAFIMKNIARSLTGLATQLDMLTTKIRYEANTKRALPRETA